MNKACGSDDEQVKERERKLYSAVTYVVGCCDVKYEVLATAPPKGPGR